MRFTTNSIALRAYSMQDRALKGIKSGAFNSLPTMNAHVEPSLASAKPDDKFQFERHGYFVANRVDHKYWKVVFNKITGLKDTWSK